MNFPRHTLLTALLAALALALPASALADGPVTAGAYSDSTNVAGAISVAIAGPYAYTTAFYPGVLAAVNISNPAAPGLAGVSAAAPSLMNGSNVTLAGGYAYVVSENRNGPCMPGPAPACSAGSNDDGSGNGLTILDIHSNPAVPTIVGSLTDPVHLFGAYGVAVSGNYAYVASQGCLPGQPCPNPAVGNSFSIIDISNPAAPTLVSTLHNNALPAPYGTSNALFHADSVAVSGHYAYVTASLGNNLTVIDISNPGSPTVAAVLHDDTNLAVPVDVTTQGNYAYVANQTTYPYHSNVTVVDISNPTAPKVVGALPGVGQLVGAYRIRVRGDFAYTSAVYAGSVAAIDISNPASPRLAGSVTNPATLNRTTGLDLDPSGQYVVATSPFLASQVQPLYAPIPPAPGSSPVTGTVSTIALDPSPIAVAITPASQPTNPTKSTTASFSFTVNDAVSAVQCKLDGAAFGFCTTPTTQVYSGLPAGNHTFTVQATDAAGRTATAAYTWSVEGKPGKPGLSHSSLAGLGKGKAKLVFTVQSGKYAALLKTIVVGLPKGLGYSSAKKSLAKGIVAKIAGGKATKFTYKIKKGVLTITLRSASDKVQVTIANPALTVAGSLAKAARAHKVASLSVTIKATDTARVTTRLSLKFNKPR